VKHFIFSAVVFAAPRGNAQLAADEPCWRFLERVYFSDQRVARTDYKSALACHCRGNTTAPAVQTTSQGRKTVLIQLPCYPETHESLL
jgi:hypothetical protein